MCDAHFVAKSILSSPSSRALTILLDPVRETHWPRAHTCVREVGLLSCHSLNPPSFSSIPAIEKSWRTQYSSQATSTARQVTCLRLCRISLLLGRITTSSDCASRSSWLNISTCGNSGCRKLTHAPAHAIIIASEIHRAVGISMIHELHESRRRVTHSYRRCRQ